MRIYPWLLFLAIQLSSFAAADDVMSWDEARQKHLLLVAAKPSYPDAAEARLFRRKYTCVFELKFDYETGHLREVHVVKSTGEPRLDAYAIGAMKVWQAKPRSIHNLLVPVNFKPFGVF
jgi:outer membrane biosynthesis protein TonB